MPVAARSAGAPITAGPRFIDSVYMTLGDVLCEPELHEPLKLRYGQTYGEAVEHDAVAARDLRLRDLPAERRDRPFLRGVEAGEVRTR